MSGMLGGRCGGAGHHPTCRETGELVSAATDAPLVR